jgi:L-aspartate oxidase
LVFGARIAADIAASIPAQLQPVEDAELGVLLDPSIQLPLQLAMSQGAGVMRSESSLTETLGILQQLATRTSSAPCIAAWEVSNLYLLATAIVRSALARTESRGSHWRSDFPETSTAWEKRIIQSIDTDGKWHSRTEAVK